MDFKWKLSRPGIELEFETGSISEAIGMLEEEGTKIAEVFGFTMGSSSQAQSSTALATGTVEAETAKAPRKPRAAPAAVAPAPMPVPAAATTLPPNALNAAPTAPTEADDGIPAALRRAPPPPLVAAPPLAPPLPLAPTPPPVGLLGPKVVEALNALKANASATDPTGQQLADWLHASGLTIKGATYDEATRVVLMTSDEKLGAIATALKVAA
jgi:hypothetical protein